MLRFLSQEEQECLQFFERTIDSLEESLEVDEPRPRQAMPPASSSLRVEVLDGPAATSSPDPKAITSSLPARPPSPKDQDIIDLVRPEPDLVQHNEPMFNPTNPGRILHLYLVCREGARIPVRSEILFILCVNNEAHSLSQILILEFVPPRFPESGANPRQTHRGKAKT